MRDPSYELTIGVMAALHENAAITGSPAAYTTIPSGLKEPYLYMGQPSQQEDRVKDTYVNQVDFDVWAVTPLEENNSDRATAMEMSNDIAKVLFPTTQTRLSIGPEFALRGLRMTGSRGDEMLTADGRTYRQILSFEALIEALGVQRIVVDTNGFRLVDTLGNKLITRI